MFSIVCAFHSISLIAGLIFIIYLFLLTLGIISSSLDTMRYRRVLVSKKHISSVVNFVKGKTYIIILSISSYSILLLMLVAQSKCINHMHTDSPRYSMPHFFPPWGCFCSFPVTLILLPQLMIYVWLIIYTKFKSLRKETTLLQNNLTYDT